MHTYVKVSKKNIDFSILSDEFINVKNDSLQTLYNCTNFKRKYG